MIKNIFTLSIVMMVMFFVSSFTKVQAAEVSADVKYGQSEARSILNKINTFRKSSNAWYWNESNTQKVYMNNLCELKYDANLEKVAMLRAAEIALSYGHTRPNGDMFYSAYNECGVSYSWAGENIAAGYDTAAEVHTAWVEADEYYSGQIHRRLMLSDRFNAVGIGHVYYNGYHYWVEEFGSVSVSKRKTSAVNAVKKVKVNVHNSMIQNLSVSFDKDLAKLNAGETAKVTSVKLTIEGQWPEMLDRPVAMMPTLKASNTSVAHCSTASVTAMNAGTTTLTASLLGCSASQTVVVTGKAENIVIPAETPVASAQAEEVHTEEVSYKNDGAAVQSQKVEQTSKIKLSKTKVALKVGKSKKIKVSGIVKGDKIKSWKSNNKKVATVKNGKITAKGKGKAVITVSLKSGKKATVKVVVK